ncbi:cyclic nucleotide phosphodiesterase inhibitor-like [Amphibalanus amphitrite]|nr:cyclic nucleotide phosphodiesterase inhibitor-like [Amphibalanus amphitrite]
MACRRDRDCHTGKCGDKGRCVVCLTRADCAAGEYCSPSGSCDPLRQLHEKCENNDHCLSRACGKLGYCVECRTNQQCRSGERCSWGVCRPRYKFGESCSQNSDCDTDLCRDKTCVECDRDRDCGGNRYCTNAGRCQEKRAAGGKCTRDSQCTTGQCDTRTGDCVQCKVDRHCRGPPNNANFCIENTCMQGIPNGVCCATNSDCQSGRCSRRIRQRNTNECLAMGRRGVCR